MLNKAVAEQRDVYDTSAGTLRKADNSFRSGHPRFADPEKPSRSVVIPSSEWTSTFERDEPIAKDEKEGLSMLAKSVKERLVETPASQRLQLPYELQPSPRCLRA